MGATIRITPSAWMKIQALVVGHDKEVAWYATVDKLEVENPSFPEYRMTDILVYPQYASSAFVEDSIIDGDTTEMNDWLNSLTDEQYNKRRGQGHSHVNMAVNPSGTDEACWLRFAETVARAQENRYAITMIINKKLEMMWWACDFDLKMEFKNSDIDIVLEVEEGVSNVEFFDMSKELVKSRCSKPSSFYLFGGNEKSQASAGSYIINKPKTYGYNYNSKKANVVNLEEYLKDEKKEAESKESTNLPVPVEDEYDYNAWLNEYYGGASQFDSYSLTIRDYTSQLRKIDTIVPADFDVICEYYDGTEFGIVNIANKPADYNKMADPSSVAMTVYDAYFDKPDIDYFSVIGEDESIIDLKNVATISKILESEVVDFEIVNTENAAKQIEKALVIMIKWEEK